MEQSLRPSGSEGDRSRRRRTAPGAGRATGNPPTDQLDVFPGECRATGGHAYPFRRMTLDLLNQIARVGVTGFYALNGRHFRALHADKRSVAVARIETQAMGRKEPGMTADAQGREYLVLNTLEVSLAPPGWGQNEQGRRKAGESKTFRRGAHRCDLRWGENERPGIGSIAHEAKAYGRLPVTASGSSLIFITESGQPECAGGANSRARIALRWPHHRILNAEAACYVADLSVLQDFYLA